MNLFENAECFATNLSLAVPLQYALEELERIRESKGEDSSEYKATLELLCQAIDLLPTNNIAEA